MQKWRENNRGKNICRLVHVFAQFLFTTSESKLDYYHQKVNMCVASRNDELQKTYELKKLETFKEIS